MSWVSRGQSQRQQGRSERWAWTERPMWKWMTTAHGQTDQKRHTNHAGNCEEGDGL